MKTDTRVRRLMVTWQDPVTRGYSPLGELSHDGETYRFEYVPTPVRALPGLITGRVHQSATLFPVFEQRILAQHRGDRAQLLEQVGLLESSGPLEVLEVTGGRRMGDTYELVPIPDPGEVRLKFLVHGIRYLSEKQRDRIARLQVGEILDLLPEPDNEYNAKALLVTTANERIGYVPDPMLDLMHRMMGSESSPTIRVARVNPLEAGYNKLLLVEIAGQLQDQHP